MKKYLRHLFVLAFLLVCTVAFAPSAFALGESMNLTVTTVIDNAGAYPEAAGLSCSYSAVRIYEMRYSTANANIPSVTSSKTFNVSNNKSTTISYSSYNNAKCDTFWFEPNQYTDKHLSLAYVEYTSADNLKAYTYSPTGNSSNSYATQPFNWVEVINSKKAASVTLHFRYNPDIDSVAPDPDPEPSYSKTIDYLGDGVANPDTTANGDNDYRLYLDVLTQEAAEDNKADIIFVLDISLSMNEKLSSGQSRLAVLKSTMTDAIDNLLGNDYNRISIIKFSSSSTVLASSSTDKNQLKSAIAGLSATGYTNYYDSLLDTIEQINKMTATDTENRDKVVIFITDGEPTFATPAVSSTSTNKYAGMIYACNAARQISNVDKFYSIFIGDNQGSASALQTVTQMVNAGEEKYMVQATSATQLSNTLDRFVSKMSNALYDVVITDGLSDYVDYTGGLKITESSGSNPPVTLTLGVDYSASTTSDGLTVRFLKKLASASKYTVSFNVSSSDQALIEFDKDGYPDIGNSGTDYPGNATSSGRAGFYSNSAASLKYSFGTNSTAEKAYHKPVVQVVTPPAVTADIELNKVLNGKALEEGMFTFEVTQVTKDENGEDVEVTLGTVTNEADGSIKLDTLEAIHLNVMGTYTFKIREVIPETPIQGMTYDEKTLVVNVKVERTNGVLETEVTYPNGQQFLNTFAPDPVYVSLEARKVLAGRALGANMFSFNLLDEKGGGVDTQQNDADGNIKFIPLEFTEVGEYTYIIRESVPYPASPNIKYDLTTFTAIINVMEEDGKLVASVEYLKGLLPIEESLPTFRNEYIYSTADATIQATKILEGMQLTAGLFEFELVDANTGSIIGKAGNQVDGAISFKINYTAPGTHKYILREIIPDEESPSYIKYMTYDERVFYVTVKVEDDGSGALSLTTTYKNESNQPVTELIFYNSYQLRGGIW